MTPPPLNATAANPVTNFAWPNYLPVNADPFSASDNQVPFSENYMFSVQHELARNAVATASYVGSRGHHLLVIRQANPGDPALCLSVSAPSQVAPGSPTCGLIRNIRLRPSKALQFRVEAFNVLNHPQFYGAGSIDGNIASKTFGNIVAAASPRLIQLAAKFTF